MKKKLKIIENKMFEEEIDYVSDNTEALVARFFAAISTLEYDGVRPEQASKIT